MKLLYILNNRKKTISTNHDLLYKIYSSLQSKSLQLQSAEWTNYLGWYCISIILCMNESAIKFFKQIPKIEHKLIEPLLHELEGTFLLKPQSGSCHNECNTKM